MNNPPESGARRLLGYLRSRRPGFWAAWAGVAGFIWLWWRIYWNTPLVWFYPAIVLASLGWGAFEGGRRTREARRRRDRLLLEKATRFAFGDRVAIAGSDIWSPDGSGTVGAPPTEIVERTGSWIGGVAFPVQHVPFYWVYFDEPLQADGDEGPSYCGAVEGDALSLILKDDPLLRPQPPHRGDEDDGETLPKTLH